MWWSAAIKWLFNTPMGRGVTLAGSVAIGLAVGWWAFSSHYDKVGYERCQGEHAAALAAANADQANKNAANDKTSAAVGQQTADAAGKVIKGADADTTKTKETIDHVYQKPPTTAPVVLGSCVHPVDQRVQDAIDGAVRQANAAGGSL